MKKKKIIIITLAVVFVTVLALILSLCSIWIKYRIIDYEAESASPDRVAGIAYYNALNYKEQVMYNCILDATKELADESETVEYSYNMKEFQRIIRYLKADHPELFYVDYDNLYLLHSNHKTKVGMEYLGNQESIQAMQAEYEAEVSKALELVQGKTSEFEIELTLNDYITASCTAAKAKDDPLLNTAYGALVKKTAHCDGYAYAIKDLLERTGMICAVVFGQAGEAQHMWNIVSVDGSYYHLDTMWNDADMESDIPLMFHGYFNLTDEEIALDHKITDGQKILPRAKEDNCYYKQIGCFAGSVAELEEVFYNALLSAAKENKQYIELKCLTTKDNAELSGYYNKALERVNTQLGENTLFGAFSVYDASRVSNAITIQIFYNN